MFNRTAEGVGRNCLAGFTLCSATHQAVADAMLCADCNGLRIPFRPQLFQEQGGRGLLVVCEAHWLDEVPHCNQSAGGASGIHRKETGLKPEWQAQVALKTFFFLTKQGKSGAWASPHLCLHQEAIRSLCSSQKSQTSISWDTQMVNAFSVSGCTLWCSEPVQKSRSMWLGG